MSLSTRRMLASLALLVSLALSAPAADAWKPVVELRPEQTRVGDYLGFAVAIDGDLALLSAHAMSGVVHVYERGADGWQHAAVLAPSLPVGHQFGYSVALQGDRAVVGYSMADAVHVFERGARGAWTELAQLAPPESARRELLGRAIALDGDIVLVGAAPGDGIQSPAGSVHVFEREASGRWRWTNRLVACDSHPDDRFGTSVALSSGWALVGERSIIDRNASKRTVTAFRRNASGDWPETQRIVVSAEEHAPDFGRVLAIEGDCAMIGDCTETAQGKPIAGVVHAYRLVHGQWGEVAVLTAPNPRSNGSFGTSLAISGDTLVVGEVSDDLSSIYDVVHVFKLKGANSWQHAARIESPRGEAGSRFASRVAVSEDAFIASAYLSVAPPKKQRDRDLGGNDSLGTAWIFERSGAGESAASPDSRSRAHEPRGESRRP